MECYEKLTGQCRCAQAGMVWSRGRVSNRRGLAVAAAVNYAHLAFGTVENQLQPDTVVLQKEFFVPQFGMFLQAGARFAADAVGGAHHFAADEVRMLLGLQRPFRHGDAGRTVVSRQTRFRQPGEQFAAQGVQLGGGDEGERRVGREAYVGDPEDRAAAFLKGVADVPCRQFAVAGGVVVRTQGEGDRKSGLVCGLDMRRVEGDGCPQVAV